jgi:hypothetical protein
MDDSDDAEDPFRIPDLLRASRSLYDIDLPPKFPLSELNRDSKNLVWTIETFTEILL